VQNPVIQADVSETDIQKSILTLNEDSKCRFNAYDNQPIGSRFRGAAKAILFEKVPQVISLYVKRISGLWGASE